MTRTILILVALWLVPSGFVSEAGADDHAERLALSERYVEIASGVGYLDIVLKNSLSGQPVVGDPAFIAELGKRLDRDKIKREAAEVLAKHYEAEELEHMIKYMGSEIGQSILRKRPQYLAELGGVIQLEILATVKTIIEENNKE